MLKRLLIISASAVCLFFPKLNFGQILSHIAAAPNVGAVKNYSILSGSGAISNNAGGTTHILGDIGTFAGAISGLDATNTVGKVLIEGSPANTLAKPYLDTIYNYLESLIKTTTTYSPNVITTIGNGDVYSPGVYYLGAAATLTGTLTLDAKNDTSAIFIILIGGAFTTNGTSVVNLVNKATASHIFWSVMGAVSFVGGTTFQGSVISSGALNLGDGCVLNGRGLVTTGAISMINSKIQGAAQLDSIANVAASTNITVSAKAFLQGALNLAGTALSTTLYDSSLIPLAQPYSGTPFNHVSTSLETALKVLPTGIIDWVLVELLDRNNDTVVASRAAFITTTGNIVDVDGTAGVNFPTASIPSGVNYNLGIRHRNHLGVRTGTPIAFAAGANTLVDFTTGPNGNLYTDPTKSSNNAPMLFAHGVYSMWEGDINNKGNIFYTGRNNCSGYLLNTILSSNVGLILKTYNDGDINFKGQSSFTGRSNTDGYLLNAILGGNVSLSIYQHY